MDLSGVVKSYQGAEKLIGRDPNTLLAMPRLDDAEGMRAVFGKLGMPESPEKYEFDKPPEGVEPDADYQTWSRNTFHKLGLTASQAKTLAKEHDVYVKGLIDKHTADYKLGVEADKQALAAEWRGGFERMMNSAQTAAKALGFTPQVVDAIERSVGYAQTMKLFAEIGGKLGEDKFVGAGLKKSGFSDTMTPEEAKQAWETMKLDVNEMAALRDGMHPGHKNAAEKQRKLFSIMHPEK